MRTTRVTAASLGLVAGLALSGCGDSSDGDSGNNDPGGGQSAKAPVVYEFEDIKVDDPGSLPPLWVANGSTIRLSEGMLAASGESDDAQVVKSYAISANPVPSDICRLDIGVTPGPAWEDYLADPPEPAKGDKHFGEEEYYPILGLLTQLDGPIETVQIPPSDNEVEIDHIYVTPDLTGVTIAHDCPDPDDAPESIEDMASLDGSLTSVSFRVAGSDPGIIARTHLTIGPEGSGVFLASTADRFDLDGEGNWVAKN